MAAAPNHSSPCSDEEEIYEKIEAPKWVDFKTPEKTRPDDFGWFCLRAGCKQNHDGSMDPATLRANFLRRVMEARSPHIRLGKPSILLTPNAISKYPSSAPAKSAKSRIPRLHDASKKRVVQPIVHKLVSTPSKCASSPKNVRSGKTTKTTSRKKCIKKSGSLMRSLRNSKLVISLKGHARPVEKTLAFHTPNSTRKPTKERSAQSTATRICLKKSAKDYEENRQLAAVGHMCKSSRCAANNPNYNKSVSVPAKTRLQSQKLIVKQDPKATPVNYKKPETSVDGNKHYQRVQRQFDDGKMVGETSLGDGNRNVIQMSMYEQSCGSVEKNLDRISRNGCLEVCGEMSSTINEESETHEHKQTIREVADKELEILKSVANVAKDDPAQLENAVKEEPELMKKCGDMLYGDTTDCSPQDLASKIELKVGLENGKDVQDPALTLGMRQPKENFIGTEKIVSKKHDRIDQIKVNKVIKGTKSTDELTKEESCNEHQNENRKGIAGSHTRTVKKRSILTSSNYSNPEPQELNSKRNGLPDMAPDDFNAVENENKENTSVSANNSDINPTEKRQGPKSIYEIPKKVLKVAPEKIPNSMNSVTVEHKMKITNPKPFRFRTIERGILREANMEKKKLQALENFTGKQIKQTNPIQTETEKSLQQAQQYGDVGAKKLITESRKGVAKSRFLSAGKSEHPKMDAASQKALEKSNETEITTEQAKDQTSDLLPVQDQSARVLKQPTRKRSIAPAALPAKIASDDDTVLSQEDIIQAVVLAPERSPCIKSSSCSRGRLPPTIPKGPLLHTLCTSKTMCKRIGK